MRKILISGASRGIGKAIALKLLKEGHSLSLGVRERDDLFNTPLDPKINNSDSFLVHTYDATDQNSSKKWVDKTFETFKSVDTIIHCAGIFNRTKLSELFIFGSNGVFNKSSLSLTPKLNECPSLSNFIAIAFPIPLLAPLIRIFLIYY